MIAAPKEARWVRPQPRLALPPALFERIIQRVFPGARILDIQPLTEGLRNANFKLHLSSAPAQIVLRLYEHDASLCQKEIDILRLIANSVPVPAVIHVEPSGWEDAPPFALLRWIDGVTFRELARSGDAVALAQASHSAGQTLAAIGRTTFSRPGWLAAGPSVTTPLLEGTNPVPHFVDSCLASPNLQARMDADFRDQAHAFVWSRASRVADAGNASCLVHGDFGKRNLIVRNIAGQWSVAAVLDWEFAVSGSTLCDLGHFLRYERIARPRVEPHFSAGYLHAGGSLPQNWRETARLLDMASMCESLTHHELPGTVISELIELIRSTVENRDPR